MATVERQVFSSTNFVVSFIDNDQNNRRSAVRCVNTGTSDVVVTAVLNGQQFVARFAPGTTTTNLPNTVQLVAKFLEEKNRSIMDFPFNYAISVDV
jgi:hypothetical protein